MKLRCVLAWSSLLTALAVLVPVRRWLAVDSCLDDGGMFEYAETHCRHDAGLVPASAGGSVIR